jgi:choline dehydrogenase
LTAYDYIVVGGGSAGCVAAAQLARDPSIRVLMLERGDDTLKHPETLRADGYKDAFINDAVIWERFSTAQPQAGHQRIFMGSGTGLGGSGSVNGMVYTRGSKLDYEQWPEGWRWNDVLPDFEAIEKVLRPRRREATDFTRACLQGSQAAGFRHKEDLNDGDLSGVLGYEWMNYEGDQRRSSYLAFIRESGPPANLTIVTHALVHRLELTDGRVTGVVYAVNGVEQRATVEREVLMACGALETPKVLMLSGIGPGEALRACGLEAKHELPAVGQKLHDHPNVPLFFLGEKPVDCFYPQLYGFHRANPELSLPSGQSDSCYVFYPARSSIKQAAQRVLPGKVLPQAIYGAPTRAMVRFGLRALYATGLAESFINRTWGIVVILGKPHSRGSVTLASKSPSAPGRIDPKYLEAPEDLQTMLKAVRLARKIARSEPLKAWGNRELEPSAKIESDAALGKWIGKNLITTYHYAGTCSMGDDVGSVCDRRLKVRGLKNLRIADASAIPSTPVSALNAPSMLVGYRAARFALEDRGS